MNEVYLWTVEYKTSSGFGATEWKIKVVTKTDKYAEAESTGIKAIEKILEETPRLEFLHLLNIKPSKIAYAEF